MKQKTSMLYIMHIDWNWIKQRPHFIAEGLNEYYDINVLYPISYKRWKLVKNQIKEFEVNGIFIFPFNLNNITDKLNKIYVRRKIKKIVKEIDPNIIWLTSPLLYDFLPKNLNIKIIYDCMDDAKSFFKKQERRNKVLSSEKKLLKSSWKIFVSSEKLKNEVISRSSRNDAKIIRNAFDGKIYHQKNINSKNKKYKIGYIGTISSWLDFESLDYCIENNENIEFHLIGPQELPLSSIHKNKYVFYGSVQHSELIDLVKDFDCFIMPFKLNELSSSVDPIKLYEYINFNKPIISIFYPEIKRFEKFTEFYHDKKTLLNKLNELIMNNFKLKFSEKDRINFLKNNTWRNRVSKIVSTIE